MDTLSMSQSFPKMVLQQTAAWMTTEIDVAERVQLGALLGALPAILGALVTRRRRREEVGDDEINNIHADDVANMRLFH